jgi:fatty acid desaturase
VTPSSVLQTPTAAAPTVSTRREESVVELPTLAVAIGVFGSYVALTWFHHVIPNIVLIPLLGAVLTWSGSLQHEIIHGHPTKWKRFNRFIGRFTLDLWSPFEHYRRAHLLHHADVDALTDPRLDPESFYVTAEKWETMGSFARRAVLVYRTLLGRVLLAPIFTLSGYLSDQAAQAISGKGVEGEGCPRRRWAGHVPFMAVTIVWLWFVEFPALAYFAAIYISISALRMRSYIEHRWMPDGQSKTAMVHAAPPFALMFLNNNLHVAHHADMRAPWYQLPQLARDIDADHIAAHGAGLFSGYFDVARRYGLKPFDHPVFPDGPAGSSVSDGAAIKQTVT